MTQKLKKWGIFHYINGKTPLILLQNDLYSTFNGKISAYFTFADYLIKDKTFYFKSQGSILHIIEYLEKLKIYLKQGQPITIDYIAKEFRLSQLLKPNGRGFTC